MKNISKSIGPNVMEIMKQRVASGLDPLTGDPLQVVGSVRKVGNVCVDETGRVVTLDSRSNWVYAK